MSDTTTALAIIIDPKFHDKINEIRSKQDRAHPRWIPHINFIFPFVPIEKFDDVHSKLKTAFQENEIKQFELSFEEIDSFSQAKQFTFHLKPNNESVQKLRQIFDLIKKTFPWIQIKSHGDSLFSPHCTLAQCPKKDAQTKQNELSNWLKKEFPDGKISFTVDKICFLKRSAETNDQMTIKDYVTF